MSPRAAAKLRRRVPEWPPSSPAALNAWLLLVTTKPPSWRDPLIEWRDLPPALGDPHEGFFHPDPLGFWAEVRRWAVALLRTREPAWDASEALALTALVHVGTDPQALARAMDACRPKVVLFLDEPAWAASGWDVKRDAYHVPDPHRAGKVYEGFWGRRADGIVVGKAPQHPSTHRLYRASDMSAFLAGLGAWR